MKTESAIKKSVIQADEHPADMVMKDDKPNQEHIAVMDQSQQNNLDWLADKVTKREFKFFKLTDESIPNL